MSYAKIEITGTIEMVTGMHIGGGDGFSAIGAVDKTVVRDPLTRLPLLPGTSLKGKLRTLLARQFGADTSRFAKNPDDDDAAIRRLFGDTREYMTARLIVRDSLLANGEELLARGARTITEVKFENTINRVTAVANPRQMERVIRGSEFPLVMVYEVGYQTRGKAEPELPSVAEVEEDFSNIAQALRLLELDYLGGSGTRGYGQVKLKNLKAYLGTGFIEAPVLSQLNQQLAEVSAAAVATQTDN
jgi:CRISPR-associated protein Csm3